MTPLEWYLTGLFNGITIGVAFVMILGRGCR